MEYADQDPAMDQDYRSNDGSNDGEDADNTETKGLGFKFRGGLTLDIDVEETDDFPENGLRTPEQYISDP